MAMVLIVADSTIRSRICSFVPSSPFAPLSFLVNNAATATAIFVTPIFTAAAAAAYYSREMIIANMNWNGNVINGNVH